MVDKIKLMLAVVLAVLSVVGFYYFEEQSTLIRVSGLLGGVGLAVLVAMLSSQGRVFRDFVGETRGEFRKIVWPTRKEAWQTTAIVMVLVFLVALFLWLLDTIILAVVEYLTH